MKASNNNNNTARSSIPPINIESRPAMSNFDHSERSSAQSLNIDEWNSIYSQQMDTTCSLSNSLYDVCQCCGKPDCDNLDYFNQLVRKLESDTRLAAEIGQGLLHKHELYVTESNQQRTTLEKQLEEHKERILLLEQSLEDVENNKSDITKEKNKWFWEYQKRQKLLDETVSDLETANEKCNQLSKELDSKSSELEKLRLFKFMVRHSESREEALTSKLEDTNQELAICRKNELLLESKIKKLTTKYENLCNSHEIMLQEFQDRLNTAMTVSTTPHKFDTIKHVSYSDTNDFIDLIKELSIANTKLKIDLMNCKDQLSESKVQVIALTQKLEDLNEPGPRLQDDLKSTLKRTTSVKETNDSKKTVAFRSKTMVNPPLPTVSASLPTSSEGSPHRHFHDLDETHHSSNETLSPSSIQENGASPFVMLQEHITHVIERLRGSDIRTLNRRLKRAFDIAELSSMSNSIIDNILMDVDTLESRFLWTKSLQNLDSSFFPILDLFKDLLKQVGVLKSTMNELQAEYVKKVEESQVRVEEEIIKKRQLKREAVVAATSATAPVMSTPIAWITHMFYKPKPEHPDTPSSIITGSTGTTSSSEISSHHYYDRNSTMTKTTTESANSTASPDEEDHQTIRNYRTYLNTFPRQLDASMKRRPIPYFPPMTKSTSTGTSRSTPSIPIRNSKRGTQHRINIDYEGIGPAAIRPIPSDRDNGDWKVATFSSSWLGGK